MTDHTGYWYGIARRRVSRRRALAGGGALAVGAAGIALAGCGSGAKQGAPTETPTRGGTLHLGTALPLSAGLDPQTERGTGLQIFPRVYGYALHVDPADGRVIYDHATSVEQTDDLTYIITLHPDIRFQNIAPVSARVVTATDAARSILRFRDNRLATNRDWFTSVLDKAEATDVTTLRVTTKRPNVYSLGEVGGISGGAILPVELIDARTNLDAAGIGSGPFAIASADDRSDLRIVRNDGFFRAPVPYLDAMEWRVFADDGAKVEAFKRREIDMMPNRDKNEALAMRAFSNQIDVNNEPSLSSISIGLRVDKPPFGDLRFRMALDEAVDRGALIRDVAFGEGDVPGPVNPHLARGYWSLPNDEIVAAQKGALPAADRRADVQALLAAAGAASASFKLQVANVPQLIDVATVVRQQLQQVGLAVELEILDLLVWFANFRRGAFDATLISHLPYESPDAPTRFYLSRGPDDTTNPFGFADAGIDAIVERSWGERDRAARQQTLLDAQRKMIAARPMIQLFTSTGYASAWRTVRNRKPELNGSLAQYNYEQWIAPR